MHFLYLKKLTLKNKIYSDNLNFLIFCFNTGVNFPNILLKFEKTQLRFERRKMMKNNFKNRCVCKDIF